MIGGFKDDTTRDIFDGTNSKAARRIPKELWEAAHRKLDMLNAAHALKDLASPPGNRLEALKREHQGFHSIRINDRYRIIFKFTNGQASEVRVTDYH